MKKSKITVILVFVAIAIAAVVVAPSCEQAGVTCQVGRGAFALKFKEKSSDGDCSINMKGGVFGLHTYYHKKSDDYPDFDRAILGIKPENAGSRYNNALAYLSFNDDIDEDEIELKVSTGDFKTALPDSKMICKVDDLEGTEIKYPEMSGDGTEEHPDLPAYHATYKWKDVEVLVSEAYTGTQFKGVLTYEEMDEDGDTVCEAEFEVWGVTPSHSCLDEDGEPDDDRCDTFPNLEKGIKYGSGIDPDFPVECDEDLGLCVLKKEPPAFK